MDPLAEARDLETPSKRLTALATYPECVEAVAANPATPPDLLERLASHEKVTVRASVAGNPNAPLATLMRLAPRFPDRFLANPIIPFSLLENPDLFTDFPVEAALALMRFPDIPPACLAQLRRHANELVRHAASLHVTVDDTWSQDQWEPRAAAEVQHHWFFPATQQVWGMFFPIPGMVQPWLISWLVKHDNPQVRATVAHHPDLLPEHIAALARDESEQVRKEISEHPRLTPELLQELSQNDWEAIRVAVAGHPTTSPETLRLLAQDPSAKVRTAVAAHEHAPFDALIRLANDARVEVRNQVLRRAEMTPKRYHALLLATHYGARVIQAGEPALKPHVLHALSQDTSPEVRRAIAQNPATPRDTLLRMARDDDWRVRAAVAENPRLRLTHDEIEVLRAGKSENGRLFLAVHPHVPLSVYETLSQFPNVNIRLFLAWNPSLPLSLLEYFARHDEATVREAVAQHPSSPLTLLALLAGDQHVRVQQAVMRHPTFQPNTTMLQEFLLCGETYHRFLAMYPQLPAEFMELLAQRGSIETCATLLRHPGASESLKARLRRKLVQALIERHSPAACYPALTCLEASPQLLEECATAPDWLARLAVACNPATPPEMLTALASDGIAPVRMAARATLSERYDRQRDDEI